MDLADDVAYSVHDVEDGVVAGRIDLTALDRRGGLGDGARLVPPRRRRRRPRRRPWPGCEHVGSWPTTPYDGSRRSLAALKNLTSDLIGRFCGAVQRRDVRGLATARSCGTPPTSSCPEQTRLEMAVLKGIAAHYVMQADDRVAAMVRQRELLAELVEVLDKRAPTRSTGRSPTTGTPPSDDAARLRVVIDQVASLTDASAVDLARPARRTGSARD